jgi:hypothetical protein
MVHVAIVSLVPQEEGGAGSVVAVNVALPVLPVSMDVSMNRCPVVLG